jgi:hypothetical protein
MDMGKQIGPLPLGAWIAVVAGGLGIAWYTKSKNAATPVAQDNTGGVPGVGVGAPADWTPITSTTPTSPAGPTTNEEWATLAINWLIAQGYPPNVADSAIRKYIAGEKLSVQEYTLVGLALIAKGSPPSTLPPSQGDTTPTQPAGPQNLRVTSAKKSWLTLAWDPPPVGTPAIYTVYNVAKNDAGYSVPGTMRTMNFQTGATVPTTVSLQVDATLLDGTRTARSNIAGGRTT